MLFTPYPFADFSEAVVVYAMTHGRNQTHYIGMCRVSEFPRLTDLRRNESMRLLLDNADFMRVIHITILAIEKGEERAFNKLFDFSQTMKPVEAYVPPSAVKYVKKGRTGRPIENVETGEVYETASEACRALDLHQSNMSLHLRGNLNTIGGMKFRYLEE